MSDWHEEYRRRYARLKESGKPFFPYAVFKDIVISFLILAALCFLAHHFGAGLEAPADPTDSTYNPRPEWYFLFLFQALKMFPGQLEAVAAVLLPGTFVALLFLLPFIDRGPERHPLDRPLATGLGVFILSIISYLTWAGFQSPLTNPVEKKDPLVLAGQRIYRDMKCAYCHQIGNKGGNIGPPLDKIAGEETEEWLAKHFRDPQAASPGSTMPKLNLLDDEVQGLVAYMKSLGKVDPFTPEAPKIFKENCAVCHKIGSQGAELAPDLSAIGSVRDKNYIRRYIMDPAKINASAAMPGFKDQLTDTQIEDLSRYLSSLGR